MNQKGDDIFFFFLLKDAAAISHLKRPRDVDQTWGLTLQLPTSVKPWEGRGEIGEQQWKESQSGCNNASLALSTKKKGKRKEKEKDILKKDWTVRW